MKIMYIVLFLYYLLFEPVFGYMFFKQFAKRLAADSGERLRYYKKTLLCCWMPAGIIGFVILFWRVSAADVGIGWIKLNDSVFGKWGTYIILIVFSLLFVLYLIRSSWRKPV